MESIRNLYYSNKLIFHLAAGCGLGLLLGLIFVFISPLLAGAAIAGVILLYIAFKRPELGLLVIVLCTSSIIFEDQLPTVSLGFSLHIPDLVLLSLLGLILIRMIVEKGFKFIRTKMDLPILIFLVMLLIPTFIAMGNGSLDQYTGRRMVRVIFYYLTFFITTNLVRERKQLNLLVNGLLAVAAIISSAMLLQFLLGSSMQILPGRVEDLQTMGVGFEDITRILPPGISTLQVTFVVMVCMLALVKGGPSRWINLILCGLFGAAILITFLRSYWVGLLLVFLFMFILLRKVDLQRLFGWVMVVIFAASILFMVVNVFPNSRAMRLVNAATNRLGTVFNLGTFQGQDASVNWRLLENQYAFKSIVQNPLIGVGLRGKYRPNDYRLTDTSSNFDFTTFMHNGMLQLLVDSGILGFLAFLGVSLLFLYRGLTRFRTIKDERMKAVVLGFCLVYLAVLIESMTNNSFIAWSWTPLFGILFGTNEVIFRMNETSTVVQA